MNDVHVKTQTQTNIYLNAKHQKANKSCIKTNKYADNSKHDYKGSVHAVKTNTKSSENKYKE